MNKGDYPAFPQESAMNAGDSAAGGLTKREHFAAMAMQGIIAYKPSGNPIQIAQDIQIAIAHADELLKQLEQK